MDKRNENFKRNPFKVKLGKTQPSTETVSNFFSKQQRDNLIQLFMATIAAGIVFQFQSSTFLKNAPWQSLKQAEEQLPVFLFIFKNF